MGGGGVRLVSISLRLASASPAKVADFCGDGLRSGTDGPLPASDGLHSGVKVAVSRSDGALPDAARLLPADAGLRPDAKVAVPPDAGSRSDAAGSLPADAGQRPAAQRSPNRIDEPQRPAKFAPRRMTDYHVRRDQTLARSGINVGTTGIFSARWKCLEDPGTLSYFPEMQTIQESCPQGRQRST